MTHSYRVHYFHVIWSTKNRTPSIEREMQEGLYSYMCGIVKNHKGKPIQIGGMPDHVHLLIQLSTLKTYHDLIRALKSCSSLWVHQQYPNLKNFAWQEGFGSFSVSYSLVEKVREYIRNQEKHHANESFDDEYQKLLRLHEVNYDERFVLG